MKAILAILALCMGACATAPTQMEIDQAPPPDLPASNTSLRALVSPEFYAFGGVGYAGSTSKGELALRRILSWKDPTTELLRRFVEANTQGQAYILAALRELSPDQFKIKRQQFLSKGGDVVVQSGCIRSEESRRAVVLSIEKNRPVKALLSRTNNW